MLHFKHLTATIISDGLLTAQSISKEYQETTDTNLGVNIFKCLIPTKTYILNV